MPSDPPDAAALRERADREFPALFQLFGGYFHQDWTVEYATWQDAVAAFREEAPQHLREDAVTEIARLLAAGLDEKTLDVILYPSLECNFVPSARGLTAAAWLQDIAGVLAAAH